ncbi:MAG TPA: hypothetical protein VNM90_00500 [Haliangium sp.]|nr:hypothetical protein [Haliangium sp.]
MNMTRTCRNDLIQVCIGALALAALGACGDDGGGGGIDAGGGNGPDGGGDAVSYAADIQPIFAGKCMFCHRPGSAIDVDLLNAFDPDHGIIERENTWVPAGSQETLIVDPGNVDNSFLIKKVEAETLEPHIDGSPMPLAINRVTAAELDTIKQWISDGAQNDAFFTDNVAPIFGTRVTLGAAAGKCTWCHFPGAPNGLDVTDPFDTTTGMVNRGSIYGGTIVIPGDVENSFLIEKLESVQPSGGQPMPYQPPRLTAEEQALVRAWVEQGAKND